jgi:hypothetical protein
LCRRLKPTHEEINGLNVGLKASTTRSASRKEFFPQPVKACSTRSLNQ